MTDSELINAKRAWLILVDKYPELLASHGLWGAIQLYQWLTKEEAKELWRINQYLGLRNYDIANTTYTTSAKAELDLAVTLLKWFAEKEKLRASEFKTTI